MSDVSLDSSTNSRAIISTLAGFTDLFVQNSEHFVEIMAEVQLDPEESLVSFILISFYKRSNQRGSRVHRQLLEGSTLEARTDLLSDSIAELLELWKRYVDDTFCMIQSEAGGGGYFFT